MEKNTMSNLAYTEMEKISIATMGYTGGGQGSIGSLATIERPFYPVHRPSYSRSVYISWNSLVTPNFYSGSTTTGEPAFVSNNSFEEEGVRGVFTLKHHRTILFSQEIELYIAELPRRKPRVNFDRLAFDTDD